MQRYYYTGDMCGAGEYCCTKCGKNVSMDSGTCISICANCANTSFHRYDMIL